MKKSKLQSKILSLVALSVVFFTTFFATFASIRYVLRNSHAADDARTITVNAIWEDNADAAGYRPAADGVILKLIAKTTHDFIPVGDVTFSEQASNISLDSDAGFILKNSDLTLVDSTYDSFISDQQDVKHYLYPTNLETWYNNESYPLFILLDQASTLDLSNPATLLASQEGTEPTAKLYVLDQEVFTAVTIERATAQLDDQIIVSVGENWTINSDNTWTYQFTNLDPRADYYLYEEPITAYTAAQMGASQKVLLNEDVITITNTYTPLRSAVPKMRALATTKEASTSAISVNQRAVKVVKEWNDDSNASGSRPDDVTIHVKRQVPSGTTATFLSGSELNARIKNLVTGSGASTSTIDTTITAIQRATELPSDFTPTAANTASVSTSDNPIYIWLDGTTVYYYSDADVVYLNSDATASFKDLRALNDISGLQDIETSGTTTFHSVFQNDISLTNVNALSSWDLSNATSTWGMFINCTSLSDISGVATWDMSKSANVKFMFGAQNAFINVNANPKQGMSLTDLTPLKYWNLASATSFAQMFKGNVDLVSLEGLEDWNVSHVTDMSQMFEWDVSLTAEGTSYINSWNLNSSVDKSSIFHGLSSSIIPAFDGSSSGSGSGGSGSGSGTNNDPIYSNGWLKKGNTWEKEILINGDDTYIIWEDNVDLYSGDTTILNPRTIIGNTVIIRNSLNQRTITVTKVWDDNSNAYNSRPANIKVHLDSGNVPAEYQEIEYIEATGTQYINTGLTGNSAYTLYTDGLVRKNSNGVLINNYLNNNNRMGDIVFNYSNPRITCYWMISGNGQGSTDRCITGNSSIDLSQRFQLTQSKSGITAIQGENVLTYSYTVNTAGTNTAPIYLLHSDQANASTYTYGVIYGAKILDGDGNALRDFVPVYRKSDNVIGLYDRITGQFFTNAGSGTFLKGNNISGGSYSFVSDDSKWNKTDPNVWTYTFAVPDDASTYTVYEESVPGYDSDAYQSNSKPVADNTATINNTVSTRTIDLTKVWDDSGHADARPSTINARIFTINRDTGQFNTIANIDQWTKSGNTWTASITVSDSGNLYLYEDSVAGYLSTATPGNPILIDPTTNAASFTNTYISQPKTIIITKQWVGDSDYTSLRQNPTVHLVARNNRTPADATLRTLKRWFADDLNSITNNTAINALYLYSNGHLPAGYTLSQLQALPHIDVSDAQDNSIIAYYDSTTNAVFIYSTNQITAPQYAGGMFSGGGVDNYTGACIQSSAATQGSSATNALGLLQILDVSELDTSQTVSMSGMFQGLSYVNTLDLSNLSTSSVTDMSSMFKCDTVLTTIYASSKFTTANVTSSTDMFANDTALVGGNGSIFVASTVDKTYARIGESGTHGYFTAALDPSDYQFVSGGKWTSVGTNTWTYEFTVPDNSLEYEVYEDPIPNYDGDTYTDSRKAVVNNAATITNTLGTQQITVTKVWDDNPSNRPSDITVYLNRVNLQDPTSSNWSSSLGNTAFDITSSTNIATSGTWTDNGDNTWTYTFNISSGEDIANLIVYEADIPGYSGDATATAPKAVPASRSVTITNVAGHFDVSLKKQVTGNLGITSDTFNFNFKIFDPNGTQLIGDFSATINGVRQTITFGPDGYSGTFTHNDTITVHDLLTGYSYTITEADTEYSESYQITTTGGTVLTANTAGLSASRSLMNESQIVTFTNNLEKTSTGIDFNILPYIILLLLVLGFGGGHKLTLVRYGNQRLNNQTYISLN